MNNVVYDRDFFKSSRGLPIASRRKLAGLIVILRQDPFHSLLHTKYLKGHLSGLLSFRITRDWRVIFMFMDKIYYTIDRSGAQKGYL